MLRQVADGVLVHQSELLQNNTVVVQGRAARIELDRAYVHALRDGHAPDDPRIGPSATFGKDWLPAVADWQLQHFVGKREHDLMPG